MCGHRNHHAVLPSVPFPVGKEGNIAVFAPTSQPGHLSAGPFRGTSDVWDIDIGEAMPPSGICSLLFRSICEHHLNCDPPQFYGAELSRQPGDSQSIQLFPGGLINGNLVPKCRNEPIAVHLTER